MTGISAKTENARTPGQMLGEQDEHWQPEIKKDHLVGRKMIASCGMVHARDIMFIARSRITELSGAEMHKSSVPLESQYLAVEL